MGNEELESWLLHLLSPRIDFQFHEFSVEGKAVVLLKVSAAFRHPVRFRGAEFIRIGSYKKKLKDFPEKERQLWRALDKISFENESAANNITSDEVLQLLDFPAYFEMVDLPLPEGRNAILARLAADDMIISNGDGRWCITNLGAVLFARRLSDFRTLRRKAVRVILYAGDSRVETLRERAGNRGYAAGFQELIDYITGQLPSNEVIGQALRKQLPMFPELAIRELVANAIIHQDFCVSGSGPMIEIFPRRMEITNPGLPLVQTDRFLDSPPRSRNEAMASFMRRIGVCEERGSGVDKVVAQAEHYQLPAPLFETTDEHTRVTLFAHRDLKDMDKEDRIRACYLHACLRYVQREFLTNASLRVRFGVEEQNKAAVSRYIREAIEAGRIRAVDEAASRRMMKYVPFWAS